MNLCGGDYSVCDPLSSNQCSRSSSPRSMILPSTRKRKSVNCKSLIDPEMDDTQSRGPQALRRVHEETNQKTANNVFLLCPDNTCRPPDELLVGDDEVIERLGSQHIFHASQPHTPNTFRALSTKDNETQTGTKDFSPTGVVLECSNVHYWQRSLAWSDDEGDEEPSDSDTSREDIRQHLAFPNIVRKEFGNNNDQQKNPVRRYPRRLRRPRREGSQLHQPAASVDIFRIPDPGAHTAEIFWDEKVFSADDLEKMAKMSIGGK